MKKRTIGYLYSGDPTEDEEVFMDEARKRNIDFLLFNISDTLDEKKIEEFAGKCDVIYNSTAEDFSIEVVKTLESLGEKVVDPSDTYYYTEDKWIFFVRCKENKIPTPETALLSENENLMKQELKEFNHWPVVLKRTVGTMGEFVDKAENVNDAVRVIEKFRKKGGKNFAVIAQEFIHSPSYRVTVIDGKIAQTVLKEGSGWKATGVYAKKFEKFEVDKELEKIVNKVVKLSGISVCGIDLFKKDGKWIVLEVNSAPALDFFDNERKILVGKILDMLKRKIKN